MISFPRVLSVAVKLLERPTVAVALTVSYKASMAEALHVAIKSTVDVAQIIRNVTETATAFFIDFSEIRRPNSEAPLLFLIVANAEQTRTAIVTVFGEWDIDDCCLDSGCIKVLDERDDKLALEWFRQVRIGRVNRIMHELGLLDEVLN